MSSTPDDHAQPSLPLKHRPLGATGLRTAPIALGTVKLGRTQGLKYAQGHVESLPSDQQVIELLRAAHNLGINLLDTAPAYGVSEERLGQLLWQAGGFRREDWIIATKAGERFGPGPDGITASHYDFSPQALITSIERSRALLNVRTIDLVHLHFASSSDLDVQTLQDGRALQAMVDLKSRSVIRCIGVSVGTRAGGELACAIAKQSPGMIDTLMITLNPLETSFLPVIEQAAALGLGVLIKKPLASGHAPIEQAVQLGLATPGVDTLVVGTTNPVNLASLARLASQQKASS